MGGDGKLTTDVSPGTEDFAGAVTIDGNGKAVLGGQPLAYNGAIEHYRAAFGLARYLPE